MLKYTISSSTSLQTGVRMGEGVVIRAVGMQGDEIFAWGETPRGDPLTATRTFRVVGTGSDVPDPGTYLGTVFEVSA